MTPQTKRRKAMLRTMKRLLRARSTSERIIAVQPCSEIRGHWLRLAGGRQFRKGFPGDCREAFLRRRLRRGGTFCLAQGCRPNRGRADEYCGWRGGRRAFGIFDRETRR